MLYLLEKTKINFLSWMAIADEVRTKIMGLDGDIFIPELD